MHQRHHQHALVTLLAWQRFDMMNRIDAAIVITTQSRTAKHNINTTSPRVMMMTWHGGVAWLGVCKGNGLVRIAILVDWILLHMIMDRVSLSFEDLISWMYLAAWWRLIIYQYIINHYYTYWDWSNERGWLKHLKSAPRCSINWPININEIVFFLWHMMNHHV